MSKNFDKYHTRGADYHYRQTNRFSLKDFSAPVEARFSALIERVAKIAGEKEFSILDVGCGDGVALWLLSKRLPHAKLSGVEPVPEALAVAKMMIPKADVRQSSADSLPFPDASFDIVISSDVIEHVENPDTMLKEIHRVAKGGASIIVGTPVRHSKFPLDPNHVQEFFIEDYLDLTKHHFPTVEVIESHELSLFLRYNRPPRSFINFRLLVNIALLFGLKNPFLRGRGNRVEMFAYMNAVCKK